MPEFVRGGTAEVDRLETRIETVKHLVGIWNKFYEILITAFDPSANLEQYETEFNKVKAVVAERHDQLVSMVTHDHHVAQNVLNMMRRAVTLEAFRRLSEVEVRKTLMDWHDANLLLFETLGDLTYMRDQIERQKELGLVFHDEAVKKNTVKDILTSKWLRSLVTWVVIIGCIAGVVLNWEAIESSEFYENYLSWLDPTVQYFKGMFGYGEEG